MRKFGFFIFVLLLSISYETCSIAESYQPSLDQRINIIFGKEKIYRSYSSTLFYKVFYKCATLIILEAKTHPQLLSPENIFALRRPTDSNDPNYYGSDITVLTYDTPEGNFKIHYTSYDDTSSDVYVVIYNDFATAPENLDPDGKQKGAIKVTAALLIENKILSDREMVYIECNYDLLLQKAIPYLIAKLSNKFTMEKAIEAVDFAKKYKDSIYPYINQIREFIEKDRINNIEYIITHYPAKTAAIVITIAMQAPQLSLWEHRFGQYKTTLKEFVNSLNKYTGSNH